MISLWSPLCLATRLYVQSIINNDKLNIFTCHDFHYQVASNMIMKIHKSNIHGNNENYSCDICGLQIQKRSLVRHKKNLHEGVKYPCRQCNHEASSKGNLATHQRAVHEGVKYPCRQCNHQFTSKGNLARHQKNLHKGQ